MCAYNLCLTIANLRFNLLSDFPILVSDEYRPFLEDEGGGVTDEDCINIRFSSVARLPKPKDGSIYKGMGFCVYIQNDHYIRYYHNPGENIVPYACRVSNTDGSITVFYQEQSKITFNSCRSCFLHMAIEELMLEHGRMIVHASCVTTSYGGILFRTIGYRQIYSGRVMAKIGKGVRY